MRRSSILMFFVAIVLGVAAVLLARSVLVQNSDGDRSSRSTTQTVSVVVAASDIAFGEAIKSEKLKVVDWPQQSIPEGAFVRINDLMLTDGQTALRHIAANEIITKAALVNGAYRLSAAPLLTPRMRAVSVPVNEVAGVAGLIYPGDRVDVFFTRQSQEAMPYGELLIQDARVLAVGLDMNVAKDKPQIVRSATLEVSPIQAQKIALATATGQLSLALRHFSDNSRVRMGTVQVMELNDGTGTRLVPRLRMAGPMSEQPAAQSDGTSAAGARVRSASGAGRGSTDEYGSSYAKTQGIAVMRGTQTTIVPVITAPLAAAPAGGQ